MTENPGTDLEAQAPDMGRGVIRGVSLDQRIRYAEVMSHAGLVPRDYQGKPANVLYAVETGTMLGIHPIAAINGINIISGKPTISPALMTALVRRAGHKVRVKVTGTVKNGDVVATCEVIRADDPDFTYSASWDIDRAKRAGLWGGKSGAWANYPEAMLKARAIGEACREAAEDALCGLRYTPEELGAEVTIEGEVITDVPTPPQEPTRAPVAAPQARQAPAVQSPEAQAQRARELAVRALEQTDADAVVKARTWAVAHGLGDIDAYAVMDEADRAELNITAAEPCGYSLADLLDDVAVYIRSHEAAVRWERLQAPAEPEADVQDAVLL